LRLGTFPASGRVVPEFDVETVREIFVQPYRIWYRVHETSVEILAVIHGARDTR
jgi:toxin ParE1/3/4